MILSRTAWFVVLPAAIAAVIFSFRSYAHAAGDLKREQTRAGLIAAQLRELETYRPVATRWQERKRPTAGLAALVSETLAGRGIPASTLASVTPQPEITVPGPPGTAELKRQRAGLTLAPITLPQLGAFLDAWRAREPYWVVASIDVSPEPGKRNQSAQVGGDLPLRAVLTLDALYLDKSTDDPKGDRN